MLLNLPMNDRLRCFIQNDNHALRAALFKIICLLFYGLLKILRSYGDVTIDDDALHYVGLCLVLKAFVRDLYSATPAVTRGLRGFSGLFRKTVLM